jgi:ATP-dependent metalloprotease FtsH
MVKQNKTKKLGSGFFFWMLVILMAVFLAQMFAPSSKPAELKYSDFKQYIRDGRIVEIAISEEKISGTYTDDSGANKEFEVVPITDPNLVEELEKHNVVFRGKTEKHIFTSILFSFGPILLIIVIWILIARQMRSGGQQAMTFGRSRAQIITKDKIKISFSDVAGLDEVKEELQEIIEFLKNPKKFQHLGGKIPKGVLLYGAPGTGKCVTGDTLILTNKGPLRIKDIPKYYRVDKNNRIAGARVLAFRSEDKKTSLLPASHWYELPLSPTLRIETELGQHIEGTPEHPIIVMDSEGKFVFKHLEDVRTGDLIVIKYDTNVFGNNTEIPDTDTAYLLGLLIGDGGLSVRGRISFTTGEQKLAEFMKRYFHDRYGYTVVKMRNKYDWSIARGDIVERFVHDYGLSAVYAKDKRVPEPILRAPKEIVRAFLQGVFDTDGTQDTRRGYVQLSSASSKLVNEISILLLNLGVVNRIHKRIKRYNGYWQYYLEISGDFLPVFQQRVGFRLGKKKDRLVRYLSRVTQNTNNNLVFHQGKRINVIWECLKRTGIPVYNVFNGRGGLNYKNIWRYAKDRRQPSLGALRSFLKKAEMLCPSIARLPEYREMHGIVFSGFFFTPVKSVTKNEAVVYDLTVPGAHSFVSNGYISHNTLLAKAVAGEAGAPFFSASGSEFVEMFVGVGASRIRDLFEKARRSSPAVIFIDELDAVGRHRFSGIGGGHDEREQTLNQLLIEMDGFDTTEGTILIAATNRPDVLDPALLRPGRFDRHISVPVPDVKGREEILRVHTKKIKVASQVDMSVLARRTPGFVGSDIANLANEAALLAARRNREAVEMEDFEEAIDRVLTGPQRKSRVISEREKKIIAFHEAGHTLVAKFMPGSDPIHKVSVVPRGPALGYTLQLPTEDRYLVSYDEIITKIIVLLGGRTAEELTFKQITTGAQNDLQQATDIAYKIVSQYGMSKKIGPISLKKDEQEIFLGRDLMREKQYSEKTQQTIDEEVKTIVESAYRKATEILKEHQPALNKIAATLLEKENLDGEEVDAIIKETLGIEPIVKSQTNEETQHKVDIKGEKKLEENKQAKKD